jgi:hypothetical protein
LAKILLILHAVAALALGGAATHLALVTLSHWRGKPFRAALTRVYSYVVASLFVGTMAIGMLAYPTYRYFVAGLYLNRYAPWATNLFDMKESVAALALPLAVGIFLLGPRLDPKDSAVRIAFGLCVYGVFAAVAFSVLSGLVVVAERGI